jgi:hypothetical protein
MTPPFAIGQRVQLSARGLETGLGGKRFARMGTVVAVSRWQPYVRVRLDGARAAATYHETFWEPVPEPHETARG